jgi:hypothetical protein
MLVEVIGIDEEEMVTEPRGLTGLFMEAGEEADLPGRRVALGMGGPLPRLETVVESCGDWPRTDRVGACMGGNYPVRWVRVRSGLGLWFFWLQLRGVVGCNFVVTSRLQELV